MVQNTIGHFLCKKYLCFLIALSFFSFQMEAQNRKVYAIIIGISNYEDQGIDKLRFAHRDAECFSTYLLSDAGGNVPLENITLLVNDQATWTAMYDAMDRVREECSPGDLVYFFFSGHGDVENEKAYKQGYLLSFNTPRVNYTNRALRIMDLNEFANTLSITQKVKVVIITDACHSGSLTTQNVGGTFLAATQLKEVVANEVRLTSCKPEQLSMEDEAWGGGRSVFSYYLLNGLMGLADKEDGTITLDEMQNYLSSSLSNDPVLLSRKFVQTPVLEGIGKTALATVDKATAERLKKTQDMSAIDTSKFKPLPKTNAYYFFELFKKSGMDSNIHYEDMMHLDAAQIPEAMVNEMIRLNPDESSTLNPLLNDLRSNLDALKRFQKKLVDVIESSAATVITLYEDGDEAELEKRRYYNSLHNSYDYYVLKLAIALKLTPKTNFEYNDVLLQSLYFRSVALRLKVFQVEDAKPLLDSGYNLMKQALQIEDNAAYLHQEMGILYQQKQDLIHAKEEYQKAIHISPRWALPYRSLSIVLNQQNETDKGLRMLAIADSLKPGSSSTSVFKGILFEKKKNLLASEENYRRAISLNSRHYLPFERLGYLYSQTNEYALADSLFFESEKRKRGYHFHPYQTQEADGIPEDFINAMMSPPCLLSEDLKSNDVMGHFVKARTYRRQETLKAKEWYDKTIRIQPQNPLVYHYLGMMFYQGGDDQRASRYFLWAQQYHLKDSAFTQHCDSLRKYISMDENCVNQTYRHSQYNFIQDYYRAGESFQRWQHFSDAIEQFNQIVHLTPTEAGGYYKLWSLQDSLKRFTDEEVTLQWFTERVDEEVGQAEQAAFYRRVTLENPKSPEWYYKAGCFHYRLCMGRALGDNETFLLNLSTEGQQKELPGERDIFLSEAVLPNMAFKLYGVEEEFMPHGNPVSPHARAIWYLEEALTLMMDEERSKDVLEKLGDLYVEMHSTLKASDYYRQALNLQPENASLREKLVSIQKLDFVLQSATANMDTLWRAGKLSFKNLLFYANNLMKMGGFMKADSVLHHHLEIYPFTDSTYSLCQIRLHYLAERWKETQEACLQYQKTFGSSAQINYTLARTACRRENMKLAYDELEKSIQNGFGYYWVLKYDPVWEKARNGGRWKQITSVVKQPELGSEE